ncbi:MAG: type II toxin-antitoxin system VapC family toxin [Thermomicrobiales bacterium]
MVLDTHPFVWYHDHSPSLSTVARRIIDEGFRGERTILVPTVVVTEAIGVDAKHRLRIDFQGFLDDLERTGFRLLPFDEPILRRYLTITARLDIFDRMIVATALVYNASVVTKDEKIVASATVPVVW